MTNRKIPVGAADRQPLELYVHIPFCVKKCAYCDFLSAPSTEEEREAYVELLCREIASCGRELAGRRPDRAGVSASPKGQPDLEVCSIYVGGGTPSLLEGEQMSRIFSALRRWFFVSDDAEITVEVNPGTVTEEKLRIYREEGINRLSIGLQSVHDEELRLLGRIHTWQDFLKTYRLARKAGFQNVSVDLISALPGQTLARWEETLRTVAALEPEHISAYSLIIEPGTAFGRYFGTGEEGARAGRKEGETIPALPDEEEEREMYRRTKEILREAGYLRYEISNYARPGYACRHNLGYWDRTPYLGFGVGAASLFGHARYENPADMDGYRAAFLKKLRGEPLSVTEEMEEFLFLGLRKCAGVGKAEFFRQFQVSLDQVYGGKIRKLEDLGMLETVGGALRLTDRGIDVSNAVFAELLT